jgi:hypothetical protein
MGKYIKHERLVALRSDILRTKQHLDKLADTTGEAKKLFDSYISPILSVYEPIYSTLASHNTNNVYRSRKCKDKIPFEHIKHLYNPPSPSGRANSAAGKPILYGSSSIQTSLAEIGVKIGEIVCVATFDYSNIADGYFWFVGQLGAFYKSQEETRYLGDARVVQKPFYAESEVTYSLVFKDLLINEIFSTLSSEEDNYELNQFVIETIEKILPNDNDFNGVIFTSVKDAPGINFAIYGDAINKMPAPSVFVVEITDIDDYGCIGYKMLDYRYDKNGDLET